MRVSELKQAIEDLPDNATVFVKSYYETLLIPKQAEKMVLAILEHGVVDPPEYTECLVIK